MNRRILGAPAGRADVCDFTVELRVILLDPVGQSVFLGWDRAGASNVLGRRQIELMIIPVDLLDVVLGRLQIILGCALMTDVSLRVEL
jgi:hypothetical protein